MHDMGPFVYLHRVSLFGRCYRGPSDGGSLLRDAHSWRGHGDQTIGDTAIDHREKTDQIERDSSRLKKAVPHTVSQTANRDKNRLPGKNRARAN